MNREKIQKSDNFPKNKTIDFVKKTEEFIKSGQKPEKNPEKPTNRIYNRKTKPAYHLGAVNYRLCEEF